VLKQRKNKNRFLIRNLIFNILNISESSYFINCYCGCKLDSNTLRWKCKLSETVKEADEFALSDRKQSLSTKLLTVPCFYKQVGYEANLKKMFGSRLQFDVEFEK
jgi:hypothetical protein